ncbi:MAG: macro domain-containing protein [Burkholderiales bacterium]|nr:macro domain-containing protein [Burkholderiales bacterium]
MIRYVRGNLLEARVEALANAINTVGVMGKGIALAFKQRFDLNFRLYAAACREGEVQVGRVFVTETGEPDGPRWIVNFPTKQHWRQPSRLPWVTAGLADLRSFIVEQGVRSIAIPALGAGLGGLAWPDVRLVIEAALAELPDTQVDVYEPLGG